MNQEQFETAKRVIEADASAYESYFEPDGQACAVGGLFMSLHPDWAYMRLKQSQQIHEEVAGAFGLTVHEVDELTVINDSYDPYGEMFGSQSDPDFTEEDFKTEGGELDTGTFSINSYLEVIFTMIKRKLFMVKSLVKKLLVLKH